MAQYSFGGRLAFTRGVREATDIETIKAMLPGCQNVIKTGTDEDRSGVDYVATLRRGAQVLIDAKTREQGASRWWNGEPELALEIWSVMPGGTYNIARCDARTGWTLSECSNVDLILYTFDPKDSDAAYLLSFQILRTAFIRNFRDWEQCYAIKNQDSYRWESQCMFVPATIVLRAMTIVSCGVVVRVPELQPDEVPF